MRTFCLLVEFFLFSFSGAFAQNISLEVNIVGISDVEGFIFLGIYDNDADFNNPQKAVRRIIKKIDGKKSKILIDDLPPGIYAIALFQDENNNKILDRNLLGVPLEKYGFSNNARRKFSAPSFTECALTIYKDTEISIAIK